MRELRVNETKPGTENASDGDYFSFGVNNESRYDERVLFRVSPESRLVL